MKLQRLVFSRANGPVSIFPDAPPNLDVYGKERRRARQSGAHGHLRWIALLVPSDSHRRLLAATPGFAIGCYTVARTSPPETSGRPESIRAARPNGLPLFLA